MKNGYLSESFEIKAQKVFFQRQSTNEVTLGVSLVLSIGGISSIYYKSDNGGNFWWAEFKTLWNCLDEVVCLVRWLGYVKTLLQPITDILKQPS